MSELFTTSGEKDENVVTPTPQLQGLFLPGIDNPLAGDGFGIVTPWGGGSGTRKYNDYGISSSESIQNTQLYDLASGLVPAEGGGVTYNFEGLIGPQGLPGVAGTTLILHEYTGLNSNFLTSLPHNLDLIGDLGTAVDQMIYTSAYNTYTTEVLTFTERQPAGDFDKNWLRVASDADGSNLIAGGDSGRLYTSADYGVNWTERQPAGAVTKKWFSVASDADGSHLIAGVGGTTGGGRLYTSADYGVNWTERQPAGAVDRQWNAAASDADGSHLIVAVYGGRVYMSADYGVNWTERQPAGAVDKYWWSVASDSDGSNLIISEIFGRLYTSANAGVNWTERRPAGDLSYNWHGVASDADGSHLIAGASNSRLYTSATAGGSWVERRPAGDINQDWEAVASDSDGSYLVAGVNDGRLYISVDSGVSWVERQPAGDVDVNWYDADADDDGSHLIIGAYSGRLYTGASGTYSEATWAETTITAAGRALLDDATAAAQRTTLGLVIGTNVQAWDAGLDSLAALTYVSDSFIKVTAENTYAIRTIAETKTDLSLNLVENTALSTWAGTTNITTLGTIATGTWASTDVGIAYGGTGQSTAQLAINALTAVGAATNEHVLTKDTATGNAIWKTSTAGTTFISLTDVDPANYTGEAGNAVIVNAGEDGLEFGAAPGGGGAFTSYCSVGLNGDQNISASTYTKVALNSETYDNDGEFTGGTFTAIAAGYYHISAAIRYLSLTSDELVRAIIYKNGVRVKWGEVTMAGPTYISTSVNVSGDVYLNGSTDYIELYTWTTEADAIDGRVEFTYMDIHRFA